MCWSVISWLTPVTRDHPLLSRKTANSSSSVCTHAAVRGGQEFWTTARFLQGCQQLSKGPPTENPAASGLVLLPPKWGGASPTLFLRSLTSGHLSLARNWNIHSSSVFPVSYSPTEASFAPSPLHHCFVLFCFSEDLAWSPQRQMEIKYQAWRKSNLEREEPFNRRRDLVQTLELRAEGSVGGF